MLASIRSSAASASARARRTRAEVERLLVGAAHGRILREGLRVALVGRPNVGKSSLLNRLLGMERAIVTPVAGTTRDTIEERATLGGVALHLVDTAGLTLTDDPIERASVDRSRAAAQSSDLLLFVLDGSQPLTALDTHAARELRALAAADADDANTERTADAGQGGAGADEASADAADAEYARVDAATTLRPLVLVLNKADLPARVDEQEARALWPEARAVVHTSTLTGEGVDALERAITDLALGGAATAQDALVASARHADALRRGAEDLAAAAATLADGLPLDFVAIDLRAGLEALGEITGETATADLLDRIFAEFCIGK